MSPRRSGRRSACAYKNGDYIEYEYKGSLVTGKLLKKSPSSSNAYPIWIVTPSDRRRRKEEVPEKDLGKIIDEEQAMSHRGPKLKKPAKEAPGDTPSPSSSSHSDDSPDQPKQAKKSKRGGSSSSSSSGKGSPSSEAKSKTSVSVSRKRKGDTAGGRGISKARRTQQKSVKFSQTPAVAAIISKQRKTKRANRRDKESTRIGTRSSGPVAGSAAMDLLPDHLVKRKSSSKGKKVKKDDKTVKVIKMLTGTLYLYRGDRPRAEFVRTKWN